LCAGLSRALPAGQPEALALATTATRLADAVGDKETLAFALAASTVATWSPDNLEERLGAHSRIIELADVVGWVNLSAEARMWRSAGAEELGDFDAADADLAVLDHYARSSRRPLHSALRDLRRAGRALLRGEYAEAEQLAEATLHEVDAGPDFVSGYGAQLFALRRDQGRLGEIDTVVELAVAATPDIVAWRVPLLFVLLERGRRDEARAELEAIAADRFAGLTRDWLWLGTTALAADAVVALAHAAVAEVLYDLLLPFAGRHAVLAHGVLSFGAVARPLGALAALLGRTDEARHHLRHALEANRSVGAAPAVARTLVDLAGLEIGAGVPMASPTPLLDEATALVRRLGMDGLRPGLEAAGAAAGVG
jgi:tetratricopeptide (TPR) repeat protein